MNMIKVTLSVKLLQGHCVGHSMNEKETSSAADRTLRMNAQT